ncbi:hypothetical protein ANO14919_008800 [Xylariales sp. No.14919]|nr:hypothetical protein ANO14919_008800 [Xylariales sp. No.14919]
MLAMDTISVSAVSFVLVTLLLITWNYYVHRHHEDARRLRLILDRIIEHRKIADFSFLGKTTIDQRLKLRSKPNARLNLTFKLSNSFTTSDQRVHQEFLNRARHAISPVHRSSWAKIGVLTQEILKLSRKHFDDAPPYIPLASFVRVVVFSIELHVLFKIDPSNIDLGEARKATTAINRLWIQSKNPNSIPSLYNQRVLEDALERLLPNEFHREDRTHPLNLIMPAYETLWRVVLLTFVSIAHRNEDSQTTDELQKAVENVPQCFDQKNDAEMRALAIAKEGLRLYPPTKRIYRATSTTDGENGVVAANVEKVHRDSQVWGADALQFKPTRFHNWRREGTSMAPEQATRSNIDVEYLRGLSYFPFGVGGHPCPASRGFGEKMIALLVVELTRHFGTRQKGSKIHFGNAEVQKKVSALLPSGREDMENWVLEIEGGN